ncbi:hypothetical protein BC831DRAFT_459203 [Entophlyctis helioformis]|nr:hypothetical protein BC831DRAFT_459203 [Entophlyctis helioformis]
MHCAELLCTARSLAFPSVASHLTHTSHMQPSTLLATAVALLSALTATSAAAAAAAAARRPASAAFTFSTISGGVASQLLALAETSLSLPVSATLHVATIGQGVQQYRCEANSTTGIRAWKLLGAVADISVPLPSTQRADTRRRRRRADGATRSDRFVKIADHCFDAGSPVWASSQPWDSSSVVGKRVAADAVSPGSANIPWVLLSASPAASSHVNIDNDDDSFDTGGLQAGLFDRTAFIIRFATAGGVAPSAKNTCSTDAHVGAVVDVPYTAGYAFYR